MQIPSTQQQYRLSRHGEAFQLTLADAPVVAPGPKQVLVRVHATSLNRRDLMGWIGSSNRG